MSIFDRSAEYTKSLERQLSRQKKDKEAENEKLTKDNQKSSENVKLLQRQLSSVDD